ncbi:hypothetical protein [Bosea lupini]|nr:hypothetical protein [Bosea lupini]
MAQAIASAKQDVNQAGFCVPSRPIEVMAQAHVDRSFFHAA